eukprot:GHVN01058228.1.p1 GENE.GHVN01058228.1~~GHVN01058228.1.p1  ORF type:complete len:517 (-),score=47.27 GHVN01058228.1:2141-3691(-)
MMVFTLFTTTACRHCNASKALLTQMKIPFAEINIQKYPEKRKAMLQVAERMDVPQIFLGNRHIGGNAELQNHHSSGTLRQMIEAYKSATESPLDPRLVPPSYPPKEPAPLPASYLDTEMITWPNGEEHSIRDTVHLLGETLDIKTRYYYMRGYKSCFVGSDFVALMIERFSVGREKAKRFGDELFNKDVFHHVCNEHSFEDDYLFYRLQLHESPYVLNKTVKWNAPPRASPNELVTSLMNQMDSIKGKHTGSNGRVDYKSIGQSTAFANLVMDLAELQNVDPRSEPLPDGGPSEEWETQSCLAILINLYNLMITVALAKVGPATNLITRVQFFQRVSLELNGSVNNLWEIESGMRGISNPKSSIWNPLASTVALPKHLTFEQCEPRVHFALNCGALSCPPVKLYTPYGIKEELRIVSFAFCDNQANVEINQKSNSVACSKIFSWYLGDFGGSTESMLQYLRIFLSSPSSSSGGDTGTEQLATPMNPAIDKAQVLEDMMAGDKKIEVKYLKYNWHQV